MAKNFFSFSKENYLIILAGVFLVIVGFFMMTGGGSEDPTKFNGEELFSARRITFAPILVILGYVVVIFGIMRKSAVDADPNKTKQST
ncbi:MAG TPA: DUF3098 domain-containing protein, partial [Flavobacteriales bacterium]|nr:DUF3098 domain-containing protein [Flavobacteriales bacterium]